MEKTLKKLSVIAAAALFTLTFSACSDGPAEEAGEEIDEVLTEAGNAVEDACEDVKENTEVKDEDC